MRYLRYMLILFIGLTITLTGFSLYLLYMPFYLPKPTGEYAVGMRQFYWVDTTRQELHSTDPAHPYRELMVKAWYPTEKSSAALPATAHAAALINFYNSNNKTIVQKLNALWQGDYRPIYAYYMPNVSIIGGNKPFPVIIFSHGFGVNDDFYSGYCTELASHGYVVFSINHTYDCTFVDFPDGRRVLISDEAEKKFHFEKLKIADQKNKTWVNDEQFVLNQLEKEVHNKSGDFADKLDLNHVGIFGHSFGGAAAVQRCRRDQRFAAGCSIDGPLYGEQYSAPFIKPFLFMYAQADNYKRIREELKKIADPTERLEAEKFSHERFFIDAINRLAKNMGPDVYTIDFPNAEHMTFSDLAIAKYVAPYTCLLFCFGIDSVDGYAITRAVNSYLVAFFDKYLKGSPVGILKQYKVTM